jgi:hypothetical protein
VAYRAEIEIGVKGVRSLEQLRSELNKSETAAESLNRVVGARGGLVQNIQNYVTNLSKAAQTLNLVTAGTKAETRAVQEYVTALGQANTARTRQNSLIDAEIKRREELARVQKLTAAGIFETTRFTGPIGPGPASSVLGGQSTPVEERIRRTLKAREDELQLQRALLELEQRSAKIANDKLQTQMELAALAARSVNAAKFQAAQTSPQLALPAFVERGLQLLDDSVRANASQLRIETALNGQRQRGVRFLEKQTQEEQRQVELGILGQRTNALRGTARATGAVPAGGFPTAGPLTSPGFLRTQKDIGRLGESLALGAGFPLLFGGGAGSVTGSILGSFAGSGFGGQIFGGALGQILDQAVQKTAQLGSAMQSLDLSKIEQSGIRINATLETQISLMRQVGDSAAAQAAIQQRVLNVTGALPGTVEGISDAVNVLGAAWSDFTAAAGVTLGIIGAPFAAALGAALEIVNNLFRGFNVVLSAVGGLIKAAGEFTVALVAGQDALKAIQTLLQQNNTELEKARAAYAPILGTLNGEVLLTREILNLEKQKTTENKARNAELSYAQNILKINAEVDKEIRDAQEKQTEATKALVSENVRLLNVKRNQRTEEAAIALSLELTRIRQEEVAKRAREAEQATKARIQQETTALNLQSQILSVFVDQTKAQVATEAFVKGELAGLEAQLKIQNDIDEARLVALDKERRSALLSAETAQQQDLINNLYDRRLDLLQRQNNLEAAQAERSANRLRLEKELSNIQRTRDIEDTLRPVQRQQQNVAFDIAAFTTPQDQLERERLVFDQRIRAFDAELQIQRTIADLTKEINSGSLNAEALKAKQADLAAQQQKLTLLTEELTLLDQLEQRQLRLQQFFTRYGQLIQTVSGEIANVVTFGISEIIRGTKTAEQVFADFLNAVGSALLQTAQQMIAQYIAIGIARIFAGLGGGGGGIFGSGGAPNFSGAFSSEGPFGAGWGGFSGAMSMPGLANGGPVSAGGAYVVGERGPELFVPSTGGGVMSNSDLRAAMNSSGAGGSGSPILNMSFETTTIGGVEYVSRDQLEQAMAETRRAAARDGAQRGMTMTLDRIQNSSSTRRRIGV